MLSTEQKQAILRRAGIAVPALPSRRASEQQQQADAEPIPQASMQADGRLNLAEHWSRTIDALFVDYSAARAAKSLREAEEARQLGAMRCASDRATA